LRVAGPNALGAASYGKDLRALGLAPVSTSKGKARLFVTPRGTADPTAWRRLAEPRPILDGRFVSAPGVFAWDRIDPGSALLAGLLPDDLAGSVADIGAGFGFLSDAVLRASPGVTRLDAYEADAVAAGCARANLAAFGSRARVHWHDVAAGIGTGGFDAVVANPPFHDPDGETRALGQRFIEVAAAALKPGGRLFVVANRHLPYEDALARHFARAAKLAETAAFKAYAATR
jgi:16S rRNA (guanine1207-N2)-methyltransferase